MKRLVLPLALALLGAACASSRTTSPPGQPAPASGTTPPSAPAPPTTGVPPAGPPPVASPTPPASSRGPVGDYRSVLKLYRANLSEDFIIDRVRRDGIAYELGADQIIELRTNGVSERVIQAMLDTRDGSYTPASDPYGAPRRPPEDRVVIDAPPPSGPPTAIGDPPIVWEGVVRREPGIVILKNRWHVGRLTFAENQLRWEDARDSSKNLLIPWNAVTEQFMTCLKKAGGNECFEWGFRTSGGDEYRFRDVTWEQGDDTKVHAIHSWFRSRFASLVDSNRPVDEK